MIDIISLQSLLSCDTLSSETADNIMSMIKKEKERKVLQFHIYDIGGPYKCGNGVYYTTHAPWVKCERINRKDRDDLIDVLYDHYFPTTNQLLTVLEVYKNMLQYYEQEKIVSNLTLVHYKADWEKYIVKADCKWVDKPIKDVTPGQIFEHYRRITADCAIQRSTFNNVKTVVNAVFSYAYIQDIPCIDARQIDTSRLRFAPKRNKWENVYSLTDRKKILEECEKAKPTVYIKAIELMFCLDVRIGELRAVHKSDVNLENQTIFIGHQMVDEKTEEVNRHSTRKNIMKGKQESGKRTEPLSKRAVKVIEWLFETYPDTEWLLPNKTLNGPIYMHRFNDKLKDICEKVGIKYLSSHGIRFHNISALYDAGVSEKEIQRLSGHSTAKMTQYYNRRISDPDEDAKIRAVLD